MTDKPTWKDIKREYLLMLIKEGDLSNSQLDDIIREARRMTSDRAHISKVGSIEDMRRIVETQKGIQTVGMNMRKCHACGSHKVDRKLFVMEPGSIFPDYVSCECELCKSSWCESPSLHTNGQIFFTYNKTRLERERARKSIQEIMEGK